MIYNLSLEVVLILLIFVIHKIYSSNVIELPRNHKPPNEKNKYKKGKTNLKIKMVMQIILDFHQKTRKKNLKN